MKSNALRAHVEDDPFPALLASVTDHFAGSEGPFFTTDAAGLFELFLSGLDESIRQVYACHSCRHFFERFGDLVTIDAAGEQRPAVWPLPSEVPPAFLDAIVRVTRAVDRAKVTDVFLSSDSIWGTPETGVWHHLYVRNPKPYRHALLTAWQAMAEKTQEREMLLRGLAEYSREAVAAALPLLESDSLYRSEKVLGVAKWLLDRHDERAVTKHKSHRENLTWRAVATAPPGWCHVKTTMISTLLDDIVAGLPFATISRRFADKMHPLQYLRPQAAPSAGQLAEAEKVVAALKSAGSLERRYARLDEVEKLWEPKAPVPEVKPEGGVFSHLKVNGVYRPTIAQPDPPAVAVTWEKFAREVLPKAERIEYHVPSFGPFVALLTAVNPDAPPILQWDREDRRNPVSWYVYPGGTVSSQWGLRMGEWAEVSAVALFPHMWGGAGAGHHGNGVTFLLAGCMDTRESSAGLFPEILRSEYHGIRAAIEAYSRAATPSGREQGSACGVDLRQWGQSFRVTTATGRLSYRIDRWG